jgi:hypothetical protein
VRDIRVIERREEVRLALKARDAIGVRSEQLRQDLIATSRFSRVSRAR